MSLQGTVCMKFTPKQYMKLYECGLLYFDYNKLNTTTKVLESVVNIVQQEWLPFLDFKKITSTLKEQPPHSDCIATVN